MSKKTITHTDQRDILPSPNLFPGFSTLFTVFLGFLWFFRFFRFSKFRFKNNLGEKLQKVGKKKSGKADFLQYLDKKKVHLKKSGPKKRSPKKK